MTEVDKAALAPAEKAGDDAMKHLANVLVFGSVIHPDDRNAAYENALSFFNSENPDSQIDGKDYATLRTYDPQFATPTPPSADVQKVRALDWQEILVDRGDGSSDVGGWEADSGFDNFYSVEQYFASDSYGFSVKFEFDVIGDFDDPDRAKECAQKDFEKRALALIQSAAHGGGTKSDGGGKVGSSPALASEGQQRVHEHGVMPVGDTAANMDSIGAGPSDTRPDCSNLSYLKQPFPSDPAQEPITDLEWLAAHQSLALSFDGFGDDDPAWKVHQVTGGRNDREWNLVGSGDTPANALNAARFALIEGRT